MDISSILTNANIRPSYQRVTILKALSMCKTHPTAEELFERLAEISDVAISRATLYNTLQLFVKNGIITEVDMHSNETHYEPNLIFHPHFHCEKCGRIIDISGEAPELTLPDGYVIHRYSMNVSGTCPECSEKNNNNENNN